MCARHSATGGVAPFIALAVEFQVLCSRRKHYSAGANATVELRPLRGVRSELLSPVRSSSAEATTLLADVLSFVAQSLIQIIETR